MNILSLQFALFYFFCIFIQNQYFSFRNTTLVKTSFYKRCYNIRKAMPKDSPSLINIIA